MKEKFSLKFLTLVINLYILHIRILILINNLILKLYKIGGSLYYQNNLDKSFFKKESKNMGHF